MDRDANTFQIRRQSHGPGRDRAEYLSPGILRQGSSFRGFPPAEVDPDGFYLKHLQPFFSLTEGSDWAVFDLVPMRRALEKGELTLDNQNLVRSLKGFDALVLIPAVTAAAFPDYD